MLGGSDERGRHQVSTGWAVPGACCAQAVAQLLISQRGRRRRAPSVRCLQQDYTSKLRNKTQSELHALRSCVALAERPSAPASVDWFGCLHLRSVMLGPKQVHKVMEDSSFVWRSTYAPHLRSWLRLFSSTQLLVVDPAGLLEPSRAPEGLRRLARFAGLAVDEAAIRDDVVRPMVHENARQHILGKRGPPSDVARSLQEWLRPHNCDLAGLLLRHGLLTRSLSNANTRDSATALLPWLRDALESSDNWARGDEGVGVGMCEGVESVDEWFIGT